MKTLIRALLLSFAFLATSPAFAVLPDNASEIKSHLEFMGYDVSYFKEHIVAKHPVHPNIVIGQHTTGLVVSKPYKSTERGRQNRTKLISLANDLNAAAMAVRYYVDKDGDLIVEAYYPGSYNKQSFSLFIDAVNMMQKQIAGNIKELSLYLE